MAMLTDLQFLPGAPTMAPEDATPLIGRMRLMLSTLRPRSDAEALKLLRTSFPQATLGERLSALTRAQR